MITITLIGHFVTVVAECGGRTIEKETDIQNVDRVVKDINNEISPNQKLPIKYII